MKIHTNDFKNELIKFGREIDCVISYELSGETIELGSSELNSITPHYEGSILKSVMKQLDIESNVEIPKGTVLNCQFGLKVNGEYEYLNFGNYVVYDVEKQEDTKDYKITCYDKILYSMKSYESMNISYPIIIRNYINSICNKLGLTFKNINDEFANYDKEITTELYLDSEGNDLGYTFRDVLDELAQVTASTICINESTDELEIRYINDTNDLIDEYYLKDVNVKFGEKYGPINSIVLSRASESDNVYLQDEDSIATNGLCEIKIKDNQIMNFNNRSDYLPDILEKLDGLEYYLNDFSSTGIAYYNLCDRYNIGIDNNTYSCIMFNDEFKITQGLEEIIHTELPEESETDYTKADKTDRKINQTYIIVDKQNQTIQSLVSEVGDYSDRISTVEQDVESISQSIRDFEDLVRENTGRERVFVENAMAGTIQYLSITGKFELLYPNSSLYPSSNIYPLSPYLVVENVPEVGEVLKRKIYTLPIDKIETGDTFEIDLEGNCTLTKQDDSIIDLGILNVELFEGDNYLYIPSYHPELLNYHVSYVIKNEYTSVFATRVEMNSAITQTADEINLEVSKKVDENDVVSTINQSAEKIELRANRLVIDSDNFKLSEEGNIISTSGDIGGFVLNPTSFSKNINGLYDYNEYDLNISAMIVMNRISQVGNIVEVLDVSEDNQITSVDYAKIKNIILGNLENTKTIGGTFKINSNDPKKCVIIKDDNSQEVLSMGLGGLNSDYIACKNIVCGEASESVSSWNGVTINGSTGYVRCVSLEQTSRVEDKKNFEKLNNAKEILNNTDIYKYNLKNEDDKDKKHIGFIIGDNYNYSSEITSKNNDGVDIYSMISVLWQVVKEQQTKIVELEKKIKRMESD